MRFRLGFIAVLITLALPALAQAADAPGYGAPAYVDKELAGGEPLIWNDPFHHTLLYTSHEGTTHLYRPGLQGPGAFTFISNYRNQVILWVSKDDGATWTRINYQGTGFRTDPSENTGFSDPDFTQDAGGRIYDTGIDLANDALFSSADGGITWDRGTVQCNDGDRPWLAGGLKDEVFMATDTAEDGQSDPTGVGHSLYRSTDGGMTCQRVGYDYGDANVGGADKYVGFGKLFMDHARQRLIEPEIYQDKDNNTVGIGAGTWNRGDSNFKPHFIANTTLQGHFPSIALDSADNVYLVWDTNPRGPDDSKGGCDQGPTPLANQIMLTVSRDWGKTWSKPVAVADPGNSRVLWPWAIAGDPGKVSVVWYQANKVNDPDCATDDVTWSIYASRLTGATDPASMAVADGRISPVIHTGGICQGGTTCVATGQDRRLGDFFTNAIDARGCDVIASGDTRLTDDLGGPLPTARPIMIRQTGGPTLVGNGNCGSGGSSFVLGERTAHVEKKAKKKKRARCTRKQRRRHHGHCPRKHHRKHSRRR